MARTAAEQPSTLLLVVISFAAAALVANLYYAQPLLASIGPQFGLSTGFAGAIVSITQIGYGVGLFLVVSIADLVENRRLVVTTIGLTTLGLIAAALAHSAPMFFAASLLVGICSSGAQVLLPFAAQLVPAATRGRTVGNIMAGLLLGIMLSRPLALVISASFGWRWVYGFSAVLMVVIGLALLRLMPRYQPASGKTLGGILASAFPLLWSHPPVRWRAFYQFLMFGSFSAFWAAAPIMLAQRFTLDERAIALFALVAAGGALAAPIAGRLADRGLIRATTLIAMAVAGASFFVTQWAVAALSLAALAVLTVVFDAAVQGNQVASQRIIFSVDAAIRGRVNATYMTITFLGAAVGSILGTLVYDAGGWKATAALGGGYGLVMLVALAVESARGSAGRRIR